MGTLFSLAVIGIAVWQFNGWLMWIFIIIGVGAIVEEIRSAFHEK